MNGKALSKKGVPADGGIRAGRLVLAVDGADSAFLDSGEWGRGEGGSRVPASSGWGVVVGGIASAESAAVVSPLGVGVGGVGGIVSAGAAAGVEVDGVVPVASSVVSVEGSVAPAAGVGVGMGFSLSGEVSSSAKGL